MGMFLTVFEEKTPMLGQGLLIRVTLPAKHESLARVLKTIIVLDCRSKLFPGNSGGIRGIYAPKVESLEFDQLKMEGNEDIQQQNFWRSTMINQPKRWDLNRRRGDQPKKKLSINLHQMYQKKLEVCSDIHVSVGSTCSPQLLGWI